ncbi:GNAT family N-acetyltransferase [Chengkuizengella axinellae]|uniref:GNAT family N-acetyltransferase n=1 Tax=Chengkuizengella axinellae TaxID=3064388 RepID=A0ABT9IU47_9BACL|nr:GNAT family N-acetyltransferase [Chengkuizengella sp. 2205SS18-9]MDP5272873.1 GNAT family N-acetyltransferase [Chengkuizengella sp. 2205SS18-9]
MFDMLVKLYDLSDEIVSLEELKKEGITIKRALAPDKFNIIEYVKDEFYDNWAGECDVAFSNKPISCFIAVKDKQVVGFACYDATAKGFFGPTGVSENVRGLGIGRALLYKSLISMREEGYGYAIIGAVDEAADFYKKTVHAVEIENSSPGVYERLISN